MKVTPETNKQRVQFFTHSNLKPEMNNDTFKQMQVYQEGLEELILYTQIKPEKKGKMLIELLHVTEWINKRK